jgi:hypothetical protein
MPSISTEDSIPCIQKLGADQHKKLTYHGPYGCCNAREVTYNLPSGQKYQAHNLHGPYFLPVDKLQIYADKAQNLKGYLIIQKESGQSIC